MLGLHLLQLAWLCLPHRLCLLCLSPGHTATCLGLQQAPRSWHLGRLRRRDRPPSQVTPAPLLFSRVAELFCREGPPGFRVLSLTSKELVLEKLATSLMLSFFISSPALSLSRVRGRSVVSVIGMNPWRGYPVVGTPTGLLQLAGAPDSLFW